MLHVGHETIVFCFRKTKKLYLDAPSLEGLTRQLSGGKVQPEKLFDIARRVPFLAMTIIERNTLNSPWLFRTQPLQTKPDISLHLAQPPTPVHMLQAQTQVQHKTSTIPKNPPTIDMMRPTTRITTVPMPVVDPKKVVKSSTAPNLPTSKSLSDMFRVI